MGQQQLLLLVLGIVIVGIAVVAGIQAFSEGKTKATRDAAVSDATRIISDVQAWYLKPTAFGGGGEDPANWGGVSWSSIGIDVPADSAYQTVNGCISLVGTANTGVSIGIATTTAGECAEDEFATVSVTSASASDGISWTYN